MRRPVARLCLDQTLQSDQRRGLLASWWIISGCSGGGEWERTTPWAVPGVPEARETPMAEKRGCSTHLQRLGALDDAWTDADAAE